MPVAAVPPVSESFLRAIEQSWDRILAIAQNHVQAFDDQHRQTQQQQQPPPPPPDTRSNRTSSEFYDRERLMMQALDTLFTYAHDGPGYLAFIQALTSILDPDSPVAMAFLSHIIERSALPSKQTMEAISPVIFTCMKQPSKLIQDDAPVSAVQRIMRAIGLCSKPVVRPNIIKIKHNATVIWALLAEKYAGDMCLHMWNDQVGKTLLRTLVDNNEDLNVRLFSLLALEKFSLTGAIKNMLLESSDIQRTLEQVIDECERSSQRLYTSTFRLGKGVTSSAPSLQLSTDDLSCGPQDDQEQPIQPHQHQLHARSDQHLAMQGFARQEGWTSLKHATHHMARFLKRQSMHGPTSGTANGKQPEMNAPLAHPKQPARKQPLQPAAFRSTSSLRSLLSSRSNKKQANNELPMNAFDVGLIPPPGKIRETWAKYLQLAFCARWALENVFNEGKKKIESSRWSLGNSRAIMNPFDATPHWKFGYNGLELRNDRPHFESVRATASVKTGKWYYETLLLSSGIMQLGWATSRCRFTPEEGYGVGDDCNGFAFDTYRTAVWADGTAVYPQSRIKIRCNSGDVLGSFLDLDNGLCSYFINGKDLGLTIEFENPTKQAAKANAAAAAALAAAATTPSNASQATVTLTPPLGPSFCSESVSSGASVTSSRHSDSSSSMNTSIATSSAIQQSSLRYRRRSRPARHESSTHIGVSDAPGASSSATKQPSPVTLSTSPHSPVFSTSTLHGYSSSVSSSSSSSLGAIDAQLLVQQQQASNAQTDGSPATVSDEQIAVSSKPTHKPAKGLGLYPAVSLTTHQHIILNLGDRPWLYPPPVTCRYRGISDAGHLDKDYRRRVLRWVSQRGYRIRKLHLAENHRPIRPRSKHTHSNNGLGIGAYDDSSSSPMSGGSSANSTDSLVEYDWDGPLCTICFSEPKNIILLPCHHGGIGERCAKVLDMCPLCRSDIEDRMIMDPSQLTREPKQALSQ
ncbi:hypothetical protein BC940DRAFT_347505 [Gongronella butleri]|nr:hypothetical protein BC940DRAFT_347505 [Gongronella butleri]